MASYVEITLDTTAPQSPKVEINGGDAATTSQNVSLAVTSSDGDLTQVKIWGDVDNTANANIQTTEGASAWITVASPHSVKLSSGDGSKTLKAKLRDDVLNTTSEVSDSITLDTTAPAVTADAPTVSKISKVATKDETEFEWEADADFVEYKIKVVPATNSIHSAGTLIPTTAGSDNVADTGAFTAATPITTLITGTDLETASSGDGKKLAKVFVKDASGLWSAV